MTFKTSLFAALVLLSFSLFAKNSPGQDTIKPSMTAIRIDQKVKIDGELDEMLWDQAEVISNFTQTSPLAGEAPSRRTEIRLTYDDQAIYIGAIMYDDRDSVSLTLSQRDQVGNADYFAVSFDPYLNGTIGYSFIVTTAGVQIDALEQLNWSQWNWNAVWESDVMVHQDKWVVEMRIPFSAVRFPKEDVQTWGIGFGRMIRRHREKSNWPFIDPEGGGWISQLGVLNGLKNIDSPLRLSFTPYVSGYIKNYSGSNGYNINGGMDVKYGLNDAFTLDLTLIPDFGQVQFDNQVLNLSPFEVRYNERRQFFTEGTELFNKHGLFYSRRIGGAPINYGNAFNGLSSNEVVEDNPNVTQILNATKLSGRTKKGTGIGIFNAITGAQHAIIRDTETNEVRRFETSPFINYNVLVVDQNLKNNSTVTLTNLSTMRNGETYDANVTGLKLHLFTKGQKYNLRTRGSLTQQFFDENNIILGHRYEIDAGKSSGKFRYNFGYNEMSDTYDRNDLGINQRNNKRRLSASMSYNVFTPKWIFNQMWMSISASHTRLYNPDVYTNGGIDGNFGGMLKNFTSFGVYGGFSPTDSYNYFEPRAEGRYWRDDEYVYTGTWWSTDYNKPFALDGGLNYRGSTAPDRYAIGYSLAPRIRFNDYVNMSFRNNVRYAHNAEGVAVGLNGIPYDGNDPIFAKRDQLTIINTLSANYTINNKMGFTFRLRHYWSKVTYNEFFALNQEGLYDLTDYTGLDADGSSYHNNSFNAFTIDAAYRWVFAPGSELSFVWKNSIFSSDNDVQMNYFQNVENLIQNPATNSFSLKILFYIDYWSLHQKVFKRANTKG